jgi:peptidoglycan/xylan/chitin deacetylase (PgdA/CDA1 family)
VVELTFDDGPDPVWTPPVLAGLAEAGLRATFFVIAPRAAAHPELVDELRAAGHAVELHCGAHVRPTRQTHDELAADTAAALATLAALGVQPRRWRTPWGLVMPWTAAVAAEHDLALTGWTIDTHDWRGDAAATMLAAIAPALHPEAIVLMHDGLAERARRTGCEETVALIPRLAAALAARGLRAGIPDRVPASAFPPPRGGSLAISMPGPPVD